MLAKVAWRNIWRNKLRSFVVMISIAIGLWAGIFASSIIKGVNAQRMDNIIHMQSSHIQIHAPKFLDNMEASLAINEASEVIEELEGIPEISFFSERSIFTGMIASAQKGRGVQIIGVNPEREKNVIPLDKYLIEGSYFEGIRKNPILLGKAVADELGVKVKKKVVLTFQGMDGEIVSAAFRVAGIYKTNDTKQDQLSVLVKMDDLAKIAASENAVHEIAILLEDETKLDQTTNALKSSFSDLEIANWKTLLPGIDYANKVSARMNFLLLIILLAAMSFGIINTMLMAVLERVRELGMLMAIGMNRRKVFGMIMLETLFLMLSALPIGLFAGWLTVTYFNKYGIDFSENFSDAFNNVGISSVIYPILEWNFYPVVIILVFIAAFLAAIYPARKAIGLKPAEALHG